MIAVAFLLRLVIFGPFCPIIFLIFWIADDPNKRNVPRWAWQLIRYGARRAMEMP